MSSLNDELRSMLLEKGACLVGFADLGHIPEEQRAGMPFGIAIAVPQKPEVINNLWEGPTTVYHQEYDRLNNLLDELDQLAADFLTSRGYKAIPKTRANVVIDEETRSTLLPHKTVATRAGLGWIGKCALLVTPEYGSAVRISSVLTDAPVEAAEPIDSSRCGTCTKCREACPGEAVSGEQWSVGKQRGEYYNAFECRKTAKERSAKIGLDATLCGMCILVCPWTKKFLEASGVTYGGKK